MTIYIKTADLIGKSYIENGRGPDGYDCYGICIEVCRRMGISLPELELIANEKFHPIDVPQAGDIVLITTVEGRHAGVMEDSINIIQVVSTGNRGVHRISINHPWVSGRIEGFYRYAG